MAQIVGVFRIGEDAQVRFTQAGQPVASLSLAFNYGQKDSDGKRPSQWIKASLWGKRAEAMAQYLTKGQQIYCVINDPHIETFQKRDGGEGFSLVGNVSEIEFAGGSKSDGSRNSQPAGNNQYEQAPQRGERNSQGAKPSFDDIGDDIPFQSHAPRGPLAHVL